MGYDFLRTPVQDFSRSKCQNRLTKIYRPSPPYFGIKRILVNVTCKIEDLQGFIDQINANIGAIMQIMLFNSPAGAPYYSSDSSYFAYDFDAFPTFNIANGTVVINRSSWITVSGGLYSVLDVVLPTFGDFDQSHPDADNGFRYYAILCGPYGVAPNPVNQTDVLWVATTYNEYIGPHPSPPFGVAVVHYSGFVSKDAAEAFYRPLLILNKMQWLWVYYPQAIEGTATPLNNLYSSKLFDRPSPSVIDNLLSTVPEPDLYTPTVGSVFKLPNPNLNGFYSEASVPNLNLWHSNWVQNFFIKDADFITPSTGAGGTGSGVGTDGGLGGAGDIGGGMI